MKPQNRLNTEHKLYDGLVLSLLPNDVLANTVKHLVYELEEVKRVARHYYQDAISHDRLESDNEYEELYPWLKDEE